MMHPSVSSPEEEMAAVQEKLQRNYKEDCSDVNKSTMMHRLQPCFTSTLDTLNLAKLNLTKSDLQMMVAAIREKQVTIRHLNLSFNNFAGGGQAVGELLLCLSSSPSHAIDTVNMSLCELTESDLQMMVAAIRGRKVAIKVLNLSGNDFTGGGAAVGELLLQLASCEEVYLRICNLTASDLRAAAAAIQGAQVHIDKLHLGGNEVPYDNKGRITRFLDVPFATVM